MSSSGDDPREHYERVTEAWRYLLGDDFHQGYFATGAESLDEATQALTLRMIDLAGMERACEVLDVGCGTGGPACLMAERRECRVTAISTSAAGLNRASERSLRRGLTSTLRFECRDGANTRFPQESFDCVWMMEVAHLVPEKDRLLREAARVLRPGGRLAFCDVIRRRELPIGEVLRRVKELGLIQRVFGRAKLESDEYYSRTMQESGFRITFRDEISAATRPTFDRWRGNALLWGAEVERLLGRTYVREFIECCDVFDGFWQQGTLGYGVLLARKAS